jgi:hypothetical protein
MKIYRKFINSVILGFAVVARSTQKVVTTVLVRGGVSEDHLMIEVDCNAAK